MPAISQMIDGKIPCQDNSFDCVESNMASEYVGDIDLALDVIARVYPSNPVIPPKPLHKPGHAFLHSDLWSHTKVAH